MKAFLREMKAIFLELFFWWHKLPTKIIITASDIVSARIVTGEKIEITVHTECQERIKRRIKTVPAAAILFTQTANIPFFYVFYEYRKKGQILLFETPYEEDILYGNKIIVPYETEEIFNKKKQCFLYFIQN